MKRRFFLLAAMLLLFIIPAGSVLKEKDLARTLGVLKAELQTNYEMQQAFMQSYEQQGMQQHQQLVWYMQQCEQIGLMLYSQSTDNTFDMAYACQQAANLRRDLDNRNSKMRQYDKIIARIKQEIERTDYLIRSLKRMPPVIDADSTLSASDSILLQAIDSLAGKKDSLLVARNSMDEEAVEVMEKASNEIPAYVATCSTSSKALRLRMRITKASGRRCASSTSMLRDGISCFRTTSSVTEAPTTSASLHHCLCRL